MVKFVRKGSILHSLIYPFSIYCVRSSYLRAYSLIWEAIYILRLFILGLIGIECTAIILQLRLHIAPNNKKKRKEKEPLGFQNRVYYFVTQFSISLSLHSFAALTTPLYINKNISSFINKAACEIIWWRGGQLLEFSPNPHWIQNQVLLVCLFLALEALLLLAIFWSKLARLWLQCSWLQRIWVSSVNLPFRWCRGRN